MLDFWWYAVKYQQGDRNTYFSPSVIGANDWNSQQGPQH